MMRYQNLTQKPELFRAPLGPDMMYPLNPPLTGPAHNIAVAKFIIDSRPLGKTCGCTNAFPIFECKMKFDVRERFLSRSG